MFKLQFVLFRVSIGDIVGKLLKDQVVISKAMGIDKKWCGRTAISAEIELIMDMAVNIGQLHTVIFKSVSFYRFLSAPNLFFFFNTP